MSQSIFTERSSPSTPPTGKVTIYAKSDGRMYCMDDTGTEFVLAAPDASDTQKGVVELATAAECATGTSTSLVPSVDAFRKANIVSETAKASTSGSAIDFTGIPSWVKRITVMFDGVSTNGTGRHIIQLSTSTTFSNTGYFAIVGSMNTAAAGNADLVTSGFALCIPAAATDLFYGSIVLTHMGSNVWVAQGCAAGDRSTDAAFFSSGRKSLGGVLDGIRYTTDAGNTFDAGSINILYE